MPFIVNLQTGRETSLATQLPPPDEVVSRMTWKEAVSFMEQHVSEAEVCGWGNGGDYQDDLRLALITLIRGV